ncbi:tripartite ATP-independent transporter DctM subunit [Evansella vedderi]|uniref:Tripartite ATP-independent transporter DctM subunit n=1 Tax=Evansella vedderi TaxID=38282 RepID=A0ABT9ZR06_9BACI|nr:TRAP transporter large permease [Evansella vedderi]MDQ0253299.1 tripartite ATP-independent transporter DctM subunit [Evansella vedderi]
MLIALLIFILLLLLKVPIAFVLGITSIIYIVFFGNIGLLATAPQRLYSGIESYGLLAIPLFMLAGELMNSGGITRRLITFSKAVIGHYRGGLAYVNVVANMFLASIIGSATAQIAMMSRVMVPSMEKEGYDRAFSASTTASAALLGPIIPPSMLFIIYSVTASQSIGTMFLAGIIPGVLLMLGFVGLIAFIGYKQNLPVSKKESFKNVMISFFQVLPALLVPAIIIIGILGGIFTPTESAAIACFIALVVGAIYRELKFKDIPNILVNTTLSTATVTLLIAMANLFGWVLTFEQIPQALAQWMTSLTESPIIFLLLITIFLLIVGTVMDGIAALIILVPIFMPLLPLYGIDPIHFGVIICINLTIGLLTPPVGAGLFIASSIGDVKFEKLSKAILPFLVVSIIVLLLLTFIPDLVLWIPSLVNG